MAAKPDAAWFGQAGLNDLDRFLTNHIPQPRLAQVWQRLRPLLCEQPTDDSAWLAETRQALEAVPLGEPHLASLMQRITFIVSEHRWNALKTAVVLGWSGHPQPLSDSDVVRRLEQLARQATNDQPPQLRSQVVEDAPGKIVEAFRNFDQSQAFNPWARQVLRNHATDLGRRRRVPVSPPEEIDAMTAPGLPTNDAQVCDMLQRFRVALDCVEWCPDPGCVDHYAAYVLDLRLRLLEVLPSEEGSGWLDAHLPLASWEAPRRIRQQWPTTGQLWGWVRAHPPTQGQHRITTIQHACNDLAPELDVEGLAPLWAQWIHRGRRIVQPTINDHLVMQVFLALHG